MVEYRPNMEVEGIAERLIKYLPDFAEIREAQPSIAYMEADTRKTSGGMTCYGLREG